MVKVRQNWGYGLANPNPNDFRSGCGYSEEQISRVSANFTH